jgi:hypothetical protein
VCHWPQHFETDLEIMHTCIDNKEEIVVVVCNGKLPACIQADKNSPDKCLRCRSRISNGLSMLPKNKVMITELPEVNERLLQIPDSFKDASDVFAFKWEAADVGKAAISTLSMRYNYEHKFENLQEHIPQLHRDIRAGYMVYEGMKKVFRSIHIDKVYLFNGRFASLRALMRLCQKEGVAFATHERAGLLEKYWIIENSIPHDKGYLGKEAKELWKSHTETDIEQAKQWYYRRRNGQSDAWYSFVKNQEKGKLPEGFERYEHKKKVVIYNSTIGEYWGVDGWDDLVYQDPNEGIEMILRDFLKNPDYVFFLRVHPNLARTPENAQVRDIEKIRTKYKNIVIIPAESPICSYDLMDNSDMILTFGSTIGVEACFWGKTSILAGKATYDELDCCYVAKNHEEVTGLINRCPPPKSPSAALVYSSWELRRGNFFNYFKPIGLSDGLFKGKRVNPSWLGQKPYNVTKRIENKLKREMVYKGILRDFLTIILKCQIVAIKLTFKTLSTGPQQK